jgi:N utilization substance protein B
MEKNQQINARARHQARKFLIQALYQWQLSEDDLHEILVQYLTDMNPKRNDCAYFQETFKAIAHQRHDLDNHIKPYLDRDINEIGPIEISVLRLAAYEFKDRLDIPYKVVLNEAIELAKIFGPEESYKYINGVLDKLVSQYRTAEIVKK